MISDFPKDNQCPEQKLQRRCKQTSTQLPPITANRITMPYLYLLLNRSTQTENRSPSRNVFWGAVDFCSDCLQQIIDISYCTNITENRLILSAFAASNSDYSYPYISAAQPYLYSAAATSDSFFEPDSASST